MGFRFTHQSFYLFLKRKVKVKQILKNWIYTTHKCSKWCNIRSSYHKEIYNTKSTLLLLLSLFFWWKQSLSYYLIKSFLRNVLISKPNSFSVEHLNSSNLIVRYENSDLSNSIIKCNCSTITIGKKTKNFFIT